MEQIQFKNDFLFGVATSAAQLEGAAQADGRGLSIWDVFSRIPNTILDHTIPETTCDMYHSYPQDLALAKELNIESFRFSFS